MGEFNVCEAINCGPLTSETFDNALKIIKMENEHNIKNKCECEEGMNQRGDTIAIKLTKEEYLEKIVMKNKQLKISEMIQNKIHCKNNSILSSYSENISNSQISFMDIDENQYDKQQYAEDDSTNSCESATKIRTLFSKLTQDLVDTRIHSNSNNNEESSLIQVEQSVSGEGVIISQNQIPEYVHNDVIEDRSVVHVDYKSGISFKCKGWIFKGRKGCVKKRKNVICHFCTGEKTFDSNNLRTHLESIHFKEETLNVKSLVFSKIYINYFLSTFRLYNITKFVLH